jgi:hypothetical protein
MFSVVHPTTDIPATGRFAPEAADQNGRLDEIRDQDGFDALAFGSL